MGLFFFFSGVLFNWFYVSVGEENHILGTHLAFLTVHPVILEHLIGLFDALQWEERLGAPGRLRWWSESRPSSWSCWGAVHSHPNTSQRGGVSSPPAGFSGRTSGQAAVPALHTVTETCADSYQLQRGSGRSPRQEQGQTRGAGQGLQASLDGSMVASGRGVLWGQAACLQEDVLEAWGTSSLAVPDVCHCSPYGHHLGTVKSPFGNQRWPLETRHGRHDFTPRKCVELSSLGKKEYGWGESLGVLLKLCVCVCLCVCACMCVRVSLSLWNTGRLFLRFSSPLTFQNFSSCVRLL